MSSYILIKRFTVNNLYLEEKNNHINIIYKLDNLYIKGFIINTIGKLIELTDKYFYNIKDEQTINILKEIDSYLNFKINNYKNLLKKKGDNYGIIFNKNKIINDKYLSNNKNIYLNLRFINKGYNNIPIIHLV